MIQSDKNLALALSVTKQAAVLTCVQPHVDLHAAWSGEAFQAALTLKGLDARVRLHVRSESALHRKSSETLFALEGFLVGVDANVAHKVAGLLELFGAVRAAMPADTVLFPDRACAEETAESHLHLLQ